MEFDTWLAAQDISPHAPQKTFAALLKHWRINVQRKYDVDISQPLGSRLTETMNASSFVESAGTLPTPPPCVWVVGQVATTSIRDTATGRLPPPVTLPPAAVQHSRRVRMMRAFRQIMPIRRWR
jgi:hypothetical protein